MTRKRNPITGRYISLSQYNDLIINGYIRDTQTLVTPKQACGGGPTNVSLLDTDVPDIGVEPLKPTPFQTFRRAVVKNAGNMADWVWKSVQNRKKNAYDIADWILSQKDEIINKVLPPKIAELIELSKNLTPITQCGKAFKNTMIEYKIKILNRKDPLIQMNLVDYEKALY